MSGEGIRLEKSGDYRFRVAGGPPGGAPCLVYATPDLLPPPEDQALRQLVNVSRLPGLVGPAIAMPDLHEGYGFPIGGVAAFDLKRGVVSPGGVGYDINCGVRLLATDRTRSDFAGRVKPALASLAKAVPAGLGASSRFRLAGKDLLDLLALGSKWCVGRGMLDEADLARIEDGGRLLAADPDLLSARALERGAAQLSTLGSGNHFLELQVVEKIFDPAAAAAFGLEEGRVTLMLHTGSRGLGYQVCADALAALQAKPDREANPTGDPQLAGAMADSRAGRDYLAAMAAAANFAYANRAAIAYHAGETLRALFGRAGFAMRLVYDVSHNIARREPVAWGRYRGECLVHRKGATRALPPGAAELPADLAPHGQPVIIPGDMGSPSWVLAGAPGGAETHASVCHGAGRRLSRKRALRTLDAKEVADRLARKGIELLAMSREAIREEAPDAYKDVNRVVEAVTGAGLARAVARLKPIGVIKG